LNLNFLNIQIKNEIEYKDYPKKGSINFIYSNNKSNATYELNRNYFIFNFKDKLIDPNFIYEGNIQFNPFYSTIKGNVEKLNLSALFRSNSLFIQFLKTKILNNKNLNIDLKINGKKISQFKNFINIFLKFKIQEGLIDIDNTKFSWNNYVDFQISDSLIYLIDNNLVVDAKLIVNVKNYNEVYKFLQTSKNLKPELKKLEFDFNYNFDQQIMNFNNIKIDNQTSQKVNNVLNKIILKKDKLQNKIYLKQIMNQVIAAYAG